MLKTLKTQLLIVAAVFCVCYSAHAADANHSAARATSSDTYVVACYFHRTVRCPTCRKISALIEQTLKSRFARQLKSGELRWVLMDYQSPKNERYARAYQLSQPTLVIADVRHGKVVRWKRAPLVWRLVWEPEEKKFFDYVVSEVEEYLRPESKDGAGASRQAQRAEGVGRPARKRR